MHRRIELRCWDSGQSVCLKFTFHARPDVRVHPGSEPKEAKEKSRGSNCIRRLIPRRDDDLVRSSIKHHTLEGVGLAGSDGGPEPLKLCKESCDSANTWLKEAA
jgi:hypothetical protein